MPRVRNTSEVAVRVRDRERRPAQIYMIPSLQGPFPMVVAILNRGGILPLAKDAVDVWISCTGVQRSLHLSLASVSDRQGHRCFGIRCILGPNLKFDFRWLFQERQVAWRLHDGIYATVRDVLQHIEHEGQYGLDGSDEVMSAWTRILLIYVARMSAADRVGPAKVDVDFGVIRLREMIRSRTKNGTWRPLAQELPNYDVIRHRFRRVFGVSPNRMLRRTRIGVAKRLLGATNQQISEIARQAGFQRLSVMERAFRCEVGCTPTAYRRQRQDRLNGAW